MLYKCPECEFTTEWSERDFADRGEPVCPEDDSDMEPAAEVAAPAYRVAVCEHTGKEIMQQLEASGEWLCLHKDSEMLDRVSVEAFKAGAGECAHDWDKKAEGVEWCTRCDATRDSDGGVIN